MTLRRAIGLLTVVVVALLWYLSTTHFGWISPIRLPPPDEVYFAFKQIAFEGYGNGLLHEHIVQSLHLVMLGFTLAATLGVAMGLAMGYSRKMEALLNPAFLLLRPIPPLAWIPLAIVWLGLGDGAKMLVIFVAAFVPAVINTFTGVRQIDAPLVEASQMLGLPKWMLFKEVVVPGAASHIFTGLRLSLQASWTTLVAAELIGALLGLGSILNQGSQDIYPAMIMVAMFFVGLCGALTTAILSWVEKYCMPWMQGRVAP